MSRKQSPKNRIFLITLYISVIAVAAVLGVVIAFGAGVQRAHGDISVGYVADNVNCTAQAWYQVSGSNTKTYFTDGNSNSTLSFSASSQAQTKNFISGNVTLNSDHDYVMVTFMFRNNAPAGGDDIRLSLTDSSVKTNIATYYYVKTSQPNTALSSNYTEAITGSTSVPGPIYIRPGSIVWYEIVIKIADLDYSASYSATSGHGILWLMENSEHSKDYQTLEYIESTGTQYINSGILVTSNDCSLYSTFEYVERSGYYGGAIFGSEIDSNHWSILYNGLYFLTGTTNGYTGNLLCWTAVEGQRTIVDITLKAPKGVFVWNGDKKTVNYGVYQVPPTSSSLPW